MKKLDSWRYRDMEALRSAAHGETPADLAVVNCRLVNVATHQIYGAEVYVRNGVVVHVEHDESRFRKGAAPASRVYDAGGAFLLPGLMDSHLHVESSMLTPYHFGCGVAVHGTTSAFTDCHELVNVAGRAAFRYMMEDGRSSPVRQLMLIPSCVPSVPGLENAGAEVTADDVREMARMDPELVVGLAEVMNYPQVIRGEKLMSAILEAAQESGLYLQSHYYQLFGRELAAYLIQGLGGNHELRTAEEVEETLRQGGWVDIRGGSSIIEGFGELLEPVKRSPHPAALRVTVCTDDRHAKDILEGHLNQVVARMIQEGIEPTVAIACATLNVAREYGISNLGEVAVSRLADMIVVPELAAMKPSAVFVSGELVAGDGKLLPPARPVQRPSLLNLKQSVKLAPVEPDELFPRAGETGEANKTSETNVIDFAGKITALTTMPLPVDEKGRLDISAHENISFITVFNRYGKGNRATAAAVNFGLKRGAVATTVSHDSHNLVVIWRNANDAALAVNRLIEAGGGEATCIDGEMKVIELPVGGLMSERPAEQVAAELREYQPHFRKAFGGEEVSLLRPAVTSLIVAPGYRVSDMGIVDVLRQKIL